jgi:hypothetical protein
MMNKWKGGKFFRLSPRQRKSTRTRTPIPLKTECLIESLVRLLAWTTSGAPSIRSLNMIETAMGSESEYITRRVAPFAQSTASLEQARLG